jgi:hypothetical protein
LTRTVYFSELDGVQKYTVRGQQQRKSVFSGFLTRTVYFSTLERDTYTAQVKIRKSAVSNCLTRAVYFSELDGVQTYTFGVSKNGTVCFPVG